MHFELKNSTRHKRLLLVHSNSHTEQQWPQAWWFPKGHFPWAGASSAESFGFTVWASVLESVLHQAWEGDTVTERNTSLSLLQPDGCSFQESIETCHRASRKKILKAWVTESKAPKYSCKASGCSCRAWTCYALTTTKHCDCLQGLAGNMAR